MALAVLRFVIRAGLFTGGGLALLLAVYLAADDWGPSFSVIAIVVGILLIGVAVLIPSEGDHVAAAFLTACAIVAVAGVVTVTGGFEKGCGDFDAESFSAADPDDRSSDGQLLWQCEILEGMSRRETIELLGPPTHERPRGLAWRVGDDFIDELYVAVRFSAEDEVDEVFRQQIG